MKIHIVKKGDTLYELSQKYNVPLQKLIEANPQIANPDQLSIGEKIKIPAGAVQVEGDGYKHVAKQGDTLWKLSKAWGIPLQTLIDANPQISDPNVLKVGDVVLIPVKGGGAANPPAHGGSNVAPGTGGKKNTAPKPTPLPAPAPEVKPAPPKEEMTKPKPIAPAPKPNPNPPVPKPMPNPNPPMPNPNPPMPIPNPPMPNPNPPMPAPIQPIKVEFVEQIQFQTIKKEEPSCKPVPECPDPWTSPFYSVEPFGGGGMMHPSSPCGCDDHTGHMTQHGHHTHPMKENMSMHEELPSGNVSSFYDFPQLPNQGPSTMGNMMDNGASIGGYPGIGNDFMHHNHEMMGMGWGPMGQVDNQPWVQEQGQGGWPTPMPYSDNNAQANMSSNMGPNMSPNMSPNMAPNSQYPGVSPQHCGPGPVWPMHSCGCHYRYPYGYEYPVNSFDPSFQAYPMNYNSNPVFAASGGQQPVWFEGGFGTFNETNLEREQQAGAFKEATISEQKESTETLEASKPQAQTRSKGKKEVKISGSSASSASKKSGSKRTGSKSGASSQKSRASSTRRNPWGQR